MTTTTVNQIGMYRNRPYTDSDGNIAYSCELIGANVPLDILPGDLIETTPRITTRPPTLHEKLDKIPMQGRLIAALVRFVVGKELKDDKVPAWAINILTQAEQFIENQGG